MPGLAPNTSLRLVPSPEPGLPPPADVQVEIANTDDAPEFDDKGAILKINHGDGSVTVSLDGKPLGSAAEPEKPAEWFDNLAERIDKDELSRLTEDLLRGIADDL